MLLGQLTVVTAFYPSEPRTRAKLAVGLVGLQLLLTQGRLELPMINYALRRLSDRLHPVGIEHPADDDAHLYKIEDGDREHAAQGGVGEDDGGA